MGHLGRKKAWFLAIGAVVGVVSSGIAVGQAVLASTYLSPTANPPEGNVPSTVWNRLDITGPQEGTAIQIDGGGPAEEPIGSDTDIPVGLSVGSPFLNMGPTRGGHNVYYGIGNYDRMSADPTAGFDYLLLLQTYSQAGGTYNNRLSVDRDGNLIVDGDLQVNGEFGTSSGCFGPVFVGLTPAGYTGNLNGAGNVGYAAANALCAAAFPDGGHVCGTEDILRTVRCSPGSLPVSGNRGWVNGGTPGFTTPAANDCMGWTTDNSIATKAYGAFWDFSGASGGVGYATACGTALPFACCSSS
ncbi:hypothetical protein JW899_04205 [Candidatus Uhrbacteria bacterium]|nr:hypothetical protein [Candidatus Uhrbacteria bacterium]